MNADPLHSQHEMITKTIKDWFHEPFEGSGYRAVRRPWGTYWDNGTVYPSQLQASEVEEFLADLKMYYEDDEPVIMLDDPQQDSQLGPAFEEAGSVKEEVDIFLAHTGPLPPGVRLKGLAIEESTRENVGEIAETKMRAFSSSDDQPPAEELKRQTNRHLTELDGIGRGMLARLSGDPAGMIWWYDDPLDIWINLLGIRKIYRGLGIGRALLQRLLIDSYERHCRSVLINVTEENTGAIRLYKRLGFSDQVYRRQHYIPPWLLLPNE